MPAAVPEQDLLDALPDGVVVADGTGTVQLMNAAAVRLLRCGSGVGRPLADVVPLQDRTGNTWFSCTRPYTGLATRTRLNEQAWYLSDGTELLVTARILRESPRAPVRRVSVKLR
jgi:PAS domain-containing protein